jgi:hypothetical protein
LVGTISDLRMQSAEGRRGSRDRGNEDEGRS